MELEKTIALLLAGTALITSPVFAQEVGTATAVNPESQSTPHSTLCCATAGLMLGSGAKYTQSITPKLGVSVQTR
jgi:hypothetical protein